MATKEELFHEIDIITTFSSKYNMKDPAQTARYVKFFKDKKVFKTPIGAQYLDRLNLIMGGQGEEPCFLCKKNTSFDGVLCEACMNKYTKGKKDFFGRTNTSTDDKDQNSSPDHTSVKSLTEVPSEEKAPQPVQQDVPKASSDTPSKKNSGGKSRNWLKFVVIGFVLLVILIALLPNDEEGEDGKKKSNKSETNLQEPGRVGFDENSFLKAYTATLVADASDISSVQISEDDIKFEFLDEKNGLRIYKMFFLDEFVGVIQFTSDPTGFGVSINTADKDRLSAYLWISEMRTLCPEVTTKEADSFIGSIYGEDGAEKNGFWFSFDFSSDSNTYFLMALETSLVK